MRPVLTGQQLAQVSNGDPFAPPVWRAPVYHTPGWIIAAVQIARILWAIVRFVARHPLGDVVVLALVGAWWLLGWPGPIVLAVLAAAALVTWRVRWPASFTRWVRFPAVSKWRRWHYHRRWPAVMTIARIAPVHRGRILVPVMGKVTSTGCTDIVRVQLVTGQSPADFADRADNLAHGFGTHLCRVRTGGPGRGRPPRVRHLVADPSARHPLAGGRCYRKQIRPVLVQGADAMDAIFPAGSHKG